MSIHKDFMHEKRSINSFVKVRYHVDSPLRFSILKEKIQVWYYYDDCKLFDVKKEVSIFEQFIKTAKLDKKCRKTLSLTKISR